MYEIREGRLGKSVEASTVIPKGALILRGWGPTIRHRTRHSLQVDHDTHVIIRSPVELINHSCEPNCGVIIRREVPCLEIHAMRRIERGEELTTDYGTFEYEIEFMTGPCLCGTASCRGRITGYRDLPEELKASYGPYIAPYLREIDAGITRSSQPVAAHAVSR